MASDINICSNALIRLGVAPISSFTEGEIGNTCGTIYPDFKQNILSTYPWRFTIEKVQLARLSAAPLNKWKYQYQLPSDLLVLRAIYASDEVGVQPEYHFEKIGGVVLSDRTELWADYQKSVSESEFPVYFTEYLITALAATLAIAVTDQAELAQYFHGLAYGTANDNGNGGLFGKAKKIDAMQYPPSQVIPNDLIAERFR